jgi:hypothetical protein
MQKHHLALQTLKKYFNGTTERVEREKKGCIFWLASTILDRDLFVEKVSIETSTSD